MGEGTEEDVVEVLDVRNVEVEDMVRLLFVVVVVVYVRCDAWCCTLCI